MDQHLLGDGDLWPEGETLDSEIAIGKNVVILINVSWINISHIMATCSTIKEGSLGKKGKNKDLCRIFT